MKPNVFYKATSRRLLLTVAVRRKAIATAEPLRRRARRLHERGPSGGGPRARRCRAARRYRPTGCGAPLPRTNALRFAYCSICSTRPSTSPVTDITRDPDRSGSSAEKTELKGPQYNDYDDLREGQEGMRQWGSSTGTQEQRSATSTPMGRVLETFSPRGASTTSTWQSVPQRAGCVRI